MESFIVLNSSEKIVETVIPNYFNVFIPVSFFQEPSSCEYVLTVSTARICSVPQLKPPPVAAPKQILCSPALSDEEFQRYELYEEAKKELDELKRQGRKGSQGSLDTVFFFRPMTIEGQCCSRELFLNFSEFPEYILLAPCTIFSQSIFSSSNLFLSLANPSIPFLVSFRRPRFRSAIACCSRCRTRTCPRSRTCTARRASGPWR